MDKNWSIPNMSFYMDCFWVSRPVTWYPRISLNKKLPVFSGEWILCHCCNSFPFTSAFYRSPQSVGPKCYFYIHCHIHKHWQHSAWPRFYLEATLMFKFHESSRRYTISCLILHWITCPPSWVSNYPLMLFPSRNSGGMH